RDRLGGGALGRTLRCDALSGALGLRGTDHQRHTLFLEDLVEAAQYVLPLSGRNLVSFEGRRTSSPAICPSAFPRSRRAMTETDSAISGGSVRDVLADTNNLSERWKTASGPVHGGQEPTDGFGDWADGAGGGREDAQRRKRRPYSLLGCHL